MYLLLQVVILSPSHIIQFSDQVKIRLNLQLIKIISIVLQKLLTNGTAISAFKIPSLLVLSKNFHLNLNELELVMRFF